MHILLATKLFSKALCGSFVSAVLMTANAGAASDPHGRQRPKPRTEANAPIASFCRKAAPARASYVRVCDHGTATRAIVLLTMPPRAVPLPGGSGSAAVAGRPCTDPEMRLFERPGELAPVGDDCGSAHKSYGRA